MPPPPQEVGPNSWHNPGKAWDAEVQAADILVIEEHGLVHVMPSYPDKIYVVLQGNAAAALMTCSFQKTCAPLTRPGPSHSGVGNTLPSGTPPAASRLPCFTDLVPPC